MEDSFLINTELAAWCSVQTDENLFLNSAERFDHV